MGGFGRRIQFTWSALCLAGYQFLLFDVEATGRRPLQVLCQDFDEGSGTSLFKWQTTIQFANAATLLGPTRQ